MQITAPRQSYQTKTNFQGFRSKDARALMAIDLDGTLAHGTNDNVKSVLKKAEEINAMVCYATGRTLQEFLRLQSERRAQGINLPNPPRLVGNHGQFVYKNINGVLVEDVQRTDVIRQQTGFERETILQTVYDISRQPKYLYSPKEIEQLKQYKAYGGFELRKKEDPHFWDSKISYYEWNPSKHFVEYFVGHDVNALQFIKEIRQNLLNKGIKTKFLYREYSKKEMDHCKEPLLRQSRPLREDEFGRMRSLFLCPADKADGVKYVAAQENIPTKEIFCAGNDENDLSLASMAKEGSFFTCVGNANRALINHAQRVNAETIIFAKEHGAKGILEGIERAIAQFRKD